MTAHGQYFRINDGHPSVVAIPPGERGAASARVRISQARSRDRPRLREVLLRDRSRSPEDCSTVEIRDPTGRHLADEMDGTSASVRRVMASSEPRPETSRAAPPADLFPSSSGGESDLDLGLSPGIDLTSSPFHRSLSDVSSGQDLDAVVSALVGRSVISPTVEDVREAVTAEAGCVVQSADAVAPTVPASDLVRPMPADSTSDEEIEEVSASDLPGGLTIDEVVAFVSDHPDLSWRDINAIFVSRFVVGSATSVQLEKMRVVIQSSIAAERHLCRRAVQTAQPFLDIDPTGTVGLLAGFQILQRASMRPT